MNVAIKKVGQRDGRDRFVLVNDQTREVITVKDVTEQSLRRFFEKHGVGGEVIENCLDRARRKYAESSRKRVDENADTMGDDDLLFELGLDDPSKVRK